MSYFNERSIDTTSSTIEKSNQSPPNRLRRRSSLLLTSLITDLLFSHSTKLISDLQPMIEKAKTSREYLADLLLELQQNEDEAQVETDRLKGINATLRKKRKSMG